MKIAIGSDHHGVALKRALLSSVLASHDVADLGTHSEDPVDYPDVARQAAEAVACGTVERGILICGTGIGMAMAVGRVAGVRAARCTEPYSAEMSRRHNDANVLCLGAEVVGVGMAERIVATWLLTPFEGGRHVRRVAKIG
jgi:ribose 5-phosphate isomerase B